MKVCLGRNIFPRIHVVRQAQPTRLCVKRCILLGLIRLDDMVLVNRHALRRSRESASTDNALASEVGCGVRRMLRAMTGVMVGAVVVEIETAER